jgi:hypothetical protein
LSADSAAIQTSTIGTDQISVATSLRGNTWASFAGPYGPADSKASSTFDVSFGISAPVDYTLAISRFVFGHNLPRPNSEFSLSSATYGSILAVFR